MKISELIKSLKRIEKEHGDIDVFCWPYDGQNRIYDISPDLTPVVSELDENRKILFIEEV